MNPQLRNTLLRVHQNLSDAERNMLAAIAGNPEEGEKTAMGEVLQAIFETKMRVDALLLGAFQASALPPRAVTRA